MISTVFLGTPIAAVPALLRLASETDLRKVITRPDRPRGRSARLRSSPVKEAANELGLAVAQPANRAELDEALTEVHPIDVGVVVAFGMILRPSTLRIPRRGFVNLHFSLLPRWRGAAPVERAILAADEHTGVTLMVMDEGLDTGPIVARRKTPIDSEENAGELAERLAEIGAVMLSETLADHVSGRMQPHPQAGEEATYAPRVTKDDAFISATWPSAQLLRTIRALAPRRGARFPDQELKVWKATTAAHPAITAGRLEFEEGRLLLGTADFPIELLEIQAPGGRRLSGADWARGRRGDLGRLP